MNRALWWNVAPARWVSIDDIVAFTPGPLHGASTVLLLRHGGEVHVPDQSPRDVFEAYAAFVKNTGETVRVFR